MSYIIYLYKFCSLETHQWYTIYKLDISRTKNNSVYLLVCLFYDFKVKLYIIFVESDISISRLQDSMVIVKTITVPSVYPKA
jgi:hypothetical protein